MRRKRRRRNKLCTVCGKPLDREGALCSKCLEALNEDSRATREFYLSASICPICRTNNIFEGEKSCPECKAKFAMINANRKEYLQEINKSRYERLKQEGICVRCGKEPAAEGHVTCETCMEKRRAKEKKDRQRNPKDKRGEWITDGKCAQCGADILVPGKRVCPNCYAILMKTISKCNEQRDERYGAFWRETNMEISSKRTKRDYPLPFE